jgi:hypothetical protein
MAQRLALIDPVVCLRPLSATLAQRAAAFGALPADLRARDISALTLVVESANVDPQQPPSPAEAKAIFAALLHDLVKVFGDNVKYLIHPDLDPARACSYRAAVLKAVLNLGPHDRSVLLRALLSQQLP